MSQQVVVEAGPVGLAGELTIPADATGLVLFAHGSGSSRLSPRNQFVAGVLNEAGLATLLFDLLTSSEETDRSNVFDIGLLGGRLAAATTWAKRMQSVSGLPIGYFGASTGAGAALVAAAQIQEPVTAIVARGGRPDLAGGNLLLVQVPTLLIVGGQDTVVVELNRDAMAHLQGECRLELVPGASHLFEEPGALEQVADLARGWFVTHMTDLG